MATSWGILTRPWGCASPTKPYLRVKTAVLSVRGKEYLWRYFWSSTFTIECSIFLM
uniref:Uncharacterized protein n=1 Tax=Anguilla anguilla TaxID=7936 RepID=A0A0E9X1V1_ANGAN